MIEEIKEPSNPEYRKLGGASPSLEAEAVQSGRSLVVVVGIDEYVHWQKLKNAVRDAMGLQQTLIEKLGFSAPIEPLLNQAATKAKIEALIEDRLREELQEDDNLVLFFAGHGHSRVDKLGGKEVETGSIVPVEARGPKEYWSDYIKLDSFLKSIGKLPARHILVILDSCQSGFALSNLIFRDIFSYQKDLTSKISRKVITSAMKDQLALDNGPISGHSLFTSTLIDGLSWGKADLDSNGLITSSELGLFLQMKVGQDTNSRQTPDFGAFDFDERGEMVIPLRNQSFDALKARASSALRARKFTDFKELVEQLIELRPSSPETLYLEYRLRFSENSFERVLQIVDILSSLNLSKELIPLSMDDLWDIKGMLYCWADILAIPETKFPLEITVLLGDKTSNRLEEAKTIPNDSNGYLIPHGKVFQLNIKNPTSYPIHVYMVKIDANGRFETIILWEDEEILDSGLPPRETHKTYPFFQTESLGTCELRLFSSPKKLRFFLFPPAPWTRIASVKKIEEEDLRVIKMKSIYYSSMPLGG